MQAAIDDELGSLPSRALITQAEGLSKRYRQGSGDYLRSQGDIAAYVAARLPATYAAAYAALDQVRGVLPGWYPDSMADIGAGPGTSMWAAAKIWPGIRSIALLEREDSMVALGKRMAAHSEEPAVREAGWIKVDITSAWETRPHDLVIAAYVLGELPEDRAADAVRRMWVSTGDAGILVIVEPGTPARFDRIRHARDQLVGDGAHVVAPCPHDRPCPMKDGDWCHFAQRVSRTRLHKRVKGGDVPFEDEKFSFVAVSRVPVSPSDGRNPGRIIRHPQVRPGHIHFEACTPEGLASVVVTRSDRERFRKAREARWGSILP